MSHTEHDAQASADCRQMYNDEAGHAQSLMQQCQQANEERAAAQAETCNALERVEAAKAEAREGNMACMRLKDELMQAHQETKDLLIDNARYDLCFPLVIISLGLVRKMHLVRHKTRCGLCPIMCHYWVC